MEGLSARPKKGTMCAAHNAPAAKKGITKALRCLESTAENSGSHSAVEWTTHDHRRLTRRALYWWSLRDQRYEKKELKGHKNYVNNTRQYITKVTTVRGLTMALNRRSHKRALYENPLIAQFFCERSLLCLVAYVNSAQKSLHAGNIYTRNRVHTKVTTERCGEGESHQQRC